MPLTSAPTTGTPGATPPTTTPTNSAPCWAPGPPATWTPGRCPPRSTTYATTAPTSGTRSSTARPLKVDEHTGGRTIAGTVTIEAGGAVGAVALKTQAAHRDGATVFLVPRRECTGARAELPKGMRLIPVTTLDGAVEALKALNTDGDVPSCRT